MPRPEGRGPVFTHSERISCRAMLDPIQIKRRLAEHGPFTETQLEARLRKQTVQILFCVFAMNSLFLAAPSFLPG
jgi:hypothetical protein